MDPFVFAAVLFAAGCHAGWNALIKFGLEPFATMALIAIASGIVAVPVAFFVPIPPPAAWPWLAASIAFHVGYYIGLTEAYRAGDMGQVYPIARGSAPLLTAIFSALLLNESIAVLGWIGIVGLVCGVFLLSARGGRDLAQVDRRAVGFALLTSVTICGYSLVDGTGARTAGNAHGYAVWLFILDGAMMMVLAALRLGFGAFATMVRYWKPGLFGGALSFAAYWIAIWAMTVAPIAIVAALRETSVLFGAAIAVVFLKEPLRLARVLAAIMIVAGLALIRLS